MSPVMPMGHPTHVIMDVNTLNTLIVTLETVKFDWAVAKSLMSFAPQRGSKSSVF